jgi:glycosyltransferase involved in cell wall biosynthesis
MEAVEKNRFIYETLLNVFFNSSSKSSDDRALSKISFLASFAWLAHPGYFADVRLERLCYRVGEEIWQKKRPNNAQQGITGRRRVLHIASETYATGGHTRLMFNIIRNDIDSIHSLLLTQQQAIDVPGWLSEQVVLSGGSVKSVYSYASEEQVALVQNAITSHDVDALFYHTHPDDAVAIAALAAAPRPAALVINHADHVFWLGSALSDVTVCYRTWSLRFSEQYRASQRVALLPTPIGGLNLEKQAALSDRKQAARKKLGIKDDEILVLTVASSGKFIPAGKYNYFRTVNKLLASNSKVLLKIAGVSDSDNLEKLQYADNRQIELLGVISEPRVYYEAADIYLDSMPFSSFTSLFEAMYFGCYPVLQFSPVDTLTIENEPSLKGVVFHTNDEEEQLATIKYAINNPSYRREIAAVCARRIEDNYMGTGWLKQLYRLYDCVPGKLQHSRDLSGLHNIDFMTENDKEAARLALSQHGDTSAILSRTIHRYLPTISAREIIDIYYRLRKGDGKYGEILSLRQMLYFVKRKVLS